MSYSYCENSDDDDRVEEYEYSKDVQKGALFQARNIKTLMKGIREN
jgi:hypothetical protein